MSSPGITGVLDAVGGAVVVGAGFGLTYALQGPRARVVTAAASSSETVVREKERAPS